MECPAHVWKGESTGATGTFPSLRALVEYAMWLAAGTHLNPLRNPFQLTEALDETTICRSGTQ